MDSGLIRLRLSSAQISALECAGIDDDDDFPTIAKSWNRASSLCFHHSDIDALFSEINGRSNAEDAAAEYESDRLTAGYARRASRALGNLASRVLRS